MLRLTCLLLASGTFMAPSAEAPAERWVEAAASRPALAQPRPETAIGDVQLTQNTGQGARVAAFWFILPNR